MHKCQNSKTGSMKAEHPCLPRPMFVNSRGIVPLRSAYTTTPVRICSIAMIVLILSMRSALNRRSLMRIPPSAKVFMNCRRLAMWGFGSVSIAPVTFAREDIHYCFPGLSRDCEHRLPGSRSTKSAD